MGLIATRACVIGALGVTVSITLRQDASGAIPREGAEAREGIDHLFFDCPRERDRDHRSSFSSISTETRVSAQTADHFGAGETESKCEQSLGRTMDTGDLFLGSQEGSVVVLGSAAAANIVCFSSLAHYNWIMGRFGIPRVTTYPSEARFLFGDGRLGEVRHEADISLGSAGNRGEFTASVLDAVIPALLREGAMGGLGGLSGNFSRVVGLSPTGGEDYPGGESRRTFHLECGRFSRGPVEELAMSR